MTSDDSSYAFSNALTVQRTRLAALEALLDVDTFHQLEARGITAGWRCLEVGAGGGSVAAWLAEAVGPDGSVLATDLDITLLSEQTHPNLECRMHDIVEDELAPAQFDLIHLRLVLAWVGDRSKALSRLVDALKPGGWLVAEEMDFVSVVPDPRLGREVCERFTRVVEAHHVVLAARNTFDPFYGRRVHGDLSDAGLAEVTSAGRAQMWSGGGPGGAVWKLTFAQLRDAMVETGTVTADEVDQVMACCDDPGFSFLSQVTVAASGRRPLAA